MIKIFYRNKCILIDTETKRNPKANRIVFASAAELHREINSFLKSRQKQLLVTGPADRAWKVFRSLFVYVEAAGGMVKNRKGNVLLIYRNRHWDLPKGKMEKGESPALCAIREVEEECGISNLRIVKQLRSTYHIFSAGKTLHLKRTRWYEMITKDDSLPKPQKEEGILFAKWMPLPQMQHAVKKMYPSLREMVSPLIFKKGNAKLS